MTDWNRVNRIIATVLDVEAAVFAVSAIQASFYRVSVAITLLALAAFCSLYTAAFRYLAALIARDEIERARVSHDEPRGGAL